MDPWLARICDRRGAVAGSGFLISDRLLLTCAHVVSAALGSQASERRPRGEVRVSFPALGQDRQATVLAGGWAAGLGDRRGDFAVLTLLGPEVDCDTIPRLGTRVVGDLRLSAFSRADSGVTTWGLAPAGPGGTGPEEPFEQLDVTTGPPLYPGVSGAPVVAPATGEVVGMLVAASVPGPGTARSRALMLPVRSIAARWPLLDRYLPRSAPHFADDEALQARELSEWEAGAVVEALSQLPDLRDRRRRAAYVSLLASGLAEAPSEVSDDTVADLWSLVFWCARFPDGFSELVDLMRRSHPGDVEVEVIAETVERLAPRPLLTPQERGELLELLRHSAGIHENLKELYRAAAGPLSPTPRRTTAKLENVVRDLEDAVSPPGGALPIAVFAARAAEFQDEPLREAFARWLGRFSARTGTPRPATGTGAALPEAVPQASESRRYFVAQLDEDLLEPNRWLLSVWTQDASGATHTLMRTHESLTIEHAKRNIASLLDAELADNSDPENVVIEFVLPMSLLNEPVEEWTFGETPHEVPIGIDHVVVVRNAERHHNALLRTRWQRRWAELQDPEAEVEVLANDSPRLLREAVVAGLPVVVWPRDPSGNSEADAAMLRTRLHGVPLGDIPSVVRELRRTAAREDRQNSGIALLWDDPGRIPDAALTLRAPTAHGTPGSEEETDR